VTEGSSAAWRRGSVLGQWWDRQSAVLAAHPVAASDARPRHRGQGHRRLCWGAARAARAARAALFAAKEGLPLAQPRYSAQPQQSKLDCCKNKSHNRTFNAFVVSWCFHNYPSWITAKINLTTKSVCKTPFSHAESPRTPYDLYFLHSCRKPILRARMAQPGSLQFMIEDFIPASEPLRAGLFRKKRAALVSMRALSTGLPSRISTRLRHPKRRFKSPTTTLCNLLILLSL
jgi:hypothetical protein